MLRVSKLIDYGTLMLAHMGQQPDRLFSASELASTLRLGQPVVSKILKLLGQHDLVKSSRGVRGGYALAHPPQQINVAQIIDALEEQPFGLTECTAQPGSCSIESDCNLRMNWQRINAAVRRTLEDVSVADMMRPSSEQPIEFPLLDRTTLNAAVCTESPRSAPWSFRK